MDCIGGLCYRDFDIAVEIKEQRRVENPNLISPRHVNGRRG
jgi:hypothetical protein